MRMALEWVRDNAEGFGGDVNRITLFGQSAGAGMIDFYSYGFASDPIANGFVLHSATVNGFPSIARNSTESSWFRVSEAVGCGPRTADANEITECMRSKTPQEILAGFSSADTSIGATPAYGPGVDDEIVFEDYSSRHAAAGGYLIGNNENEAGLFRQFQNQSDEYWVDFNQRLYTCADAMRIGQAVADGNPSWRYRYFGDFPNLAVSTNPPSGAHHGAEVRPPLRNTSPMRRPFNLTAFSSRFSSTLSRPRPQTQRQAHQTRWPSVTTSAVLGAPSPKIQSEAC